MLQGQPTQLLLVQTGFFFFFFFKQCFKIDADILKARMGGDGGYTANFASLCWV